MAIYHMHVKVISRTKSAGRTAPAAAAYRAGEKIQERATGITHDYTSKRGIVHSEILLPAGAPERLRDRATLWNDAEAAEKRVNSRIAREVEIALPSELSRVEQIELVREYARLFVRDGMCADVSIHDKNDGNPHAHMLLTTREIDAKSGAIGQKRRDWNDREKLEFWRQSWATMTNAALERAGRPERIDHRTLEAQGIERRPTIHTGRDPEKLKTNAMIKEDNAKLAEINAQLEELKAEREAERKRQQAPPKRYTIDELREMLNDFKERRREWIREHTEERLKLDADAEKIELVPIETRLSRLHAESKKLNPNCEEYDPPTRREGGFFGLFGNDVVDEEATRERREEVQKGLSKAIEEKRVIKDRHEANRAKIYDEANATFEREHPDEVQRIERVNAALGRALERKRAQEAEQKRQQEAERKAREAERAAQKTTQKTARKRDDFERD